MVAALTSAGATPRGAVEPPEPPTGYRLVCGLFLRLLGLVYLSGFLSTGVQILGLAGSGGILPYAEALAGIAAEQGSERYWFQPTLFWIDAGDVLLQGVAWAGCVFSILLVFGLLVRCSTFALFVLYLSLYHAGQVFFEFQWDYLLLESGFLAIFLTGRSRAVVWLYRWLLFRLRFVSGLAKLLSQDPSWANLTAVYYFFETQPLPHLGSWYAHQLPAWWSSLATGAALLVELVVPFMMFLPRNWRLVGAWVTVLMQVLILLTANHNYVNFLVLGLCLFLFDDRALRRVVPQAAAAWLSLKPEPAPPGRRARTVLVGLLAGFLVMASTLHTADLLAMHRSPAPVTAFLRAIEPFRIANTYHAFPNMLTERIELVIEGSRDGRIWRAYAFKYKPGDLQRPPGVVVPHQPRLDWLIWFVPWHPMFLPWFERFLERLLENAPAVVALLDRNPFADRPPRYLRVEVYRYRFTDVETRNATGRWWARETLGPFPPLPGVESAEPFKP